jgi:predicted Zn-dependent protease with MMP-like domain
MNAKTRERAMRVLLSSLLESNLSVGEMNEISEAFIDDEEFPQTFGQLIKEIVISMDNKPSSLKAKGAIPKDSKKNDETPVKTALLLIKKKRLLKNGVLERLGRLSPDIQDFIDKAPQKSSLREILNRCYNEMPQQFNEFLEWLKGREMPYDDYLEGILQKE